MAIARLPVDTVDCPKPTDLSPDELLEKPIAVLPTPAVEPIPTATLPVFSVPEPFGSDDATAPLPMAIQSLLSGVASALLPPSSETEALAPTGESSPPATSAEINSLLRPLFFPRLFAVSLATL